MVCLVKSFQCLVLGAYEDPFDTPVSSVSLNICGNVIDTVSSVDLFQLLYLCCITVGMF